MMLNDYLRSRPVFVRQSRTIQLDLVGCGGTGSYLAPRLVDIALALIQQGRTVELRFIDPDGVESKNVGRQNFLSHDIGFNKAQVLALRYGLVRGLDITALPYAFADVPPSKPYSYGGDRLRLIVGCVDNHVARQSIHDLFEREPPDPFKSYTQALLWCDCGNERYTGQVLLGNTLDPQHVVCAFSVPEWCVALPLPSLQHPELLDAPTVTPADTRASCAERLVADEQSLLINHRIAVEAADMLSQLLLTHSLRRYATYVDSLAGTSYSRYAVPPALPSLPASAVST